MATATVVLIVLATCASSAALNSVKRGSTDWRSSGRLLRREPRSKASRGSVSPGVEGKKLRGKESTLFRVWNDGSQRDPPHAALDGTRLSLLEQGSSMALHLQWGPSTPQHPNAIVTHICSDNWAPGALALGASHRRFNPEADLVLMISDHVSKAYSNLFSKVFDRVYVEAPVSPHPSITRLGSRQEADCVTLQLRTWELPYRKALYMDSDMIALKNVDTIFTQFGEMSARLEKETKYGWNGGMFLCEPSHDKFQKLQSALKTHRRSKKDLTGIQQFLNSVYPSNCIPHDGGVGCLRGKFGPTHNVLARLLTSAEISAVLQGHSPYTSLHFSGAWGANVKPWMKNCLADSPKPLADSVASFADQVFGNHGNTSLRTSLLTLWMIAFHEVEAPPGTEHLLKLDCPFQETYLANTMAKRQNFLQKLGLHNNSNAEGKSTAVISYAGTRPVTRRDG